MFNKINCIIVVAVILLLPGCFVSRTDRPMLTGYVVDADSYKPVYKCKVGEVFTDSSGFFKLKEIRYCQFVLPGAEAPSLYINEIVSKHGYINDTINIFNPFGGGLEKGAHWRVDTLFIQKREL